MILTYVRVFLLLAASFVLTVYVSGGTVWPFFDFPSFFMTVIMPFAYQWFLFGTAALRNAFSASFRKTVSLEDAEKARLFFKTYFQCTWFAAVLVILINGLIMLVYLEEKSGLVYGIAAMLISLLDAVFVNLLIILPNASLIKKRLIELSAEI